MLRFRGHETCKTYINSDLEPQINYAPVRNEGFSVQTIIVSKSRYHCRRKENAPISAVSESSTGASALNETRIH